MDIIPKLILWLILPAWIAAGFLDWICHRRSHIERRCGPWETLFHLLLLGEAGIAIVLALFLELNEPILATIAVCYVIHEITVYVDLRYAHARRDISPAEQRVHEFMTAMPFAALCLIAVLHWDDLRNLVANPSAIWSEPIRTKADPLPMGQVVGILLAVFLANLIPYFEELLRGLRFLRQPRPGRNQAK